MTKYNGSINWKQVAFFLKIGIVGAFAVLIGDFLMGWGIKDANLSGIEEQISPYLTISDGRMFCSAMCGLLGVPAAILGHFGIYKLLVPYSRKYARLYALGMLGFLACGGAGVHVSSIEAAFFYKYMMAANPEIALMASIKFASYFVLSMYIILIICWIIMVYAQIQAVLGGFSPYPRWCWALSMLVGTALVLPVCLLGNHPIVNALMLGAFSVGNVWTLAGHALFLNKAKQHQENLLNVRLK